MNPNIAPTPQQTPMQPQPAPMQGPPQPQQRPNVPNVPIVQAPTPQIKISPIAQAKLQDKYGKAADNAPLFDSLLKITAVESRARPLSNFKNPQTAVNKVDEKNQEDPNRNYQLDDINDILRGRLIYGSMDALRKGVNQFKDNLKGSDVKVAKMEDFFHKPADGYEGYHVDLEFPNGEHSRVQFHTQQSYAASMATHNIHNQFGDMAPAKIAQKTQETNEKIMALNPAEANTISTTAEAQAQPSQQQAQLMALQMIRAQKQQQQMPMGQQLNAVQQGQQPSQGMA